MPRKKKEEAKKELSFAEKVAENVRRNTAARLKKAGKQCQSPDQGLLLYNGGMESTALGKKKYARSQSRISTISNGDVKSFDKVIASNSADLHTYSGSSARVRMYWDLNDEAINGKIFKIELTKGGKKLEALISAEELEHYARAI